MSVWTQNGLMLVDASGRPIDCPTCPCDGAKPCCATTLPLLMYAYWRTAGNTPSGGPETEEYFNACMTLTYENRPDHPGGEHWWTGTTQIGGLDTDINEYYLTTIQFEMVCWTNTTPPSGFPGGGAGRTYYRMKQLDADLDVRSQVGNWIDDLATGTYGDLSLDSPFTCINPCAGPDTGPAGLSFVIDTTGSASICTQRIVDGETLPNDTLTFEGTLLVEEVPTLVSCTLHYQICAYLLDYQDHAWVGSLIITCTSGTDNYRVVVYYDGSAVTWTLRLIDSGGSSTNAWTGADFPYAETTTTEHSFCTPGDGAVIPFTIA